MKKLTTIKGATINFMTKRNGKPSVTIRHLKVNSGKPVIRNQEHLVAYLDELREMNL